MLILFPCLWLTNTKFKSSALLSSKGKPYLKSERFASTQAGFPLRYSIALHMAVTFSVKFLSPWRRVAWARDGTEPAALTEVLLRALVGRQRPGHGFPLPWALPALLCISSKQFCFEQNFPASRTPRKTTFRKTEEKAGAAAASGFRFRLSALRWARKTQHAPARC